MPEAGRLLSFCHEEAAEADDRRAVGVDRAVVTGAKRRRKDNRGRPWASNRACLEGILWVLQTGAAWRFLPDEFPSPATCWRRLKQWEEQDVWLDAWRALLGALDARRSAEVGRDISGWQLRPGEKGGSAVGKTKRGKGTKWMVLVDGQGLPMGVRLESASPGEVTLAEATLAEVRVPRPKGRPRQKPKRVIADPRLRLRSAARAVEETRHRADRSVPEEQQTTAIRRWTQDAALQTHAGSWNEPTPGSGSSADFWFAMSICSPPTAPSSISLASGLR